MQRLYFWILGALSNREGGAWWYRDYRNDYAEKQDQLNHDLESLMPILFAYSVVENPIVVHTVEDICPPLGAKIFYPNSTVQVARRFDSPVS